MFYCYKANFTTQYYSFLTLHYQWGTLLGGNIIILTNFTLIWHTPTWLGINTCTRNVVTDFTTSNVSSTFSCVFVEVSHLKDQTSKYMGPFKPCLISINRLKNLHVNLYKHCLPSARRAKQFTKLSECLCKELLYYLNSNKYYFI